MTTQKQVYRVYSLDVWGHGSDECKDYDCDGNCDGYQVNDRCKVGTLVTGEVFNVGTPHEFTSFHPSSEILIPALVENGFLTPDCDSKSITTDGDADFMIEVDRVSDGKYLLQLERENND